MKLLFNYGLWALLFALASCFLRFHLVSNEASVQLLRTATSVPRNETINATAMMIKTTDPLTLGFGDLPGYTGWSRPTRTTVAWYDVVTPTTTRQAMVGEPFVWTIQCRHEACRTLEALFDTRAYGPSILPGLVTSFHNGSYAVTMTFHDPGAYVVEIVLAFSDVAPLSSFPIATPEPAYEGFLLAGFPTTLQVVEPTDKSSRITTTGDHRPACAARHLYENDTTSALSKGRWKVSHLIRGRGQVPDSSNRTSYNTYRYGLGSVGFQMDYMYNDCDLAPLSFLMNQSMHLPDKSRTTIVFIGDSTMRNQHLLFEELFGKILSSVYLKTNDGLLVRLPEIIAGLQDLTQRYHAGELDNIYILFNAGLHEIDILCNQEFIKSRQRVISIPDAHFSCTDQYYSNLVSLTQRVLHVPSALSVFQSTSAGWLRWGNYGFAWIPTRTQLYPEAPQACADFNDIAYDVMDEYDVPVMDSFWMTRARSDHREIDKNNSRGKKMVHAGQEVNEVLLRQWMSLVLQDAFDKKSSKKH